MVDEATEFIVQMLTQMHGGTPTEVPERYVESSPITHAAAAWRHPCSSSMGATTSDALAGQMERYLARMAELGKEVAVEWFSAGHSEAWPIRRSTSPTRNSMLAFAAGAVGDRDEAPAA